MIPAFLKIEVRIVDRDIKSKIFVLRPTTHRERLTMNASGRVGSVIGLREFPVEYAINESLVAFHFSLLQIPLLSVVIPWRLSDIWKRIDFDGQLSLEYRIRELPKHEEEA